NNIEDYVEWAFLRYQASRNIAFRLGRTSTDLYLLSEYTPVGYAYTWARPPTEHYSHLGSFSYIDGVDASYSNNIHDGFLDLRLGYGSSTVKIEAQNGEPLEFKLNDTLSMSGLYSTNFWKIKLAAAFTKPSGFNNEGQQLLINGLNSIPSALWPQAAGLAEQFAFSDKEIRYYAAGYEIEIDQVTLTTEFAYTDPNWETYPDYASGYLSLAYRLNEVTLFGVYSKVKNTDDKISVTAPTSNPLLPEATQTQLEQLWQGANYNINYRTIDQDTISVGVRWDLYSQLALKAQYDYT
ncbi:hypothetical protein L4C33_22450, partial [Vibrio makurazakiensis]|uniref:hypothetical protein n=1 Tax=Vibrio makurazakiensis TaxID=2910250 RepID=UPI003D116312